MRRCSRCANATSKARAASECYAIPATATMRLRFKYSLLELATVETVTTRQIEADTGALRAAMFEPADDVNALQELGATAALLDELRGAHRCPAASSRSTSKRRR